MMQRISDLLPYEKRGAYKDYSNQEYLLTKEI
jgi:hypothetical protein